MSPAEAEELSDEMFVAMAQHMRDEAAAVKAESAKLPRR
jgi:hypothetical protein